MGRCPAGTLPGRHCGQLVAVGQIQGHGQHVLRFLVRLDVAPVAQGYQEARHVIRAPKLLIRIRCLHTHAAMAGPSSYAMLDVLDAWSQMAVKAM